ncbi:hypothetical protein M5X06_22430 [Paenibacillus alvei]|uniref:RNA polymerase sigma factor 70 region 4 type 2 domain-containing protein n=1 Tax=Paenibacillus alvei TaxID=44250 RepID=A0ABT4H2F6_PAEAL|nr:hypothetical protein [Paenibacillus alvei]MCY9763162.1 hypothetical protein [Paenibacillus alvei]MCY9769547.1 hypothetical protein [Paenibacillus alvei]
MGNDGSIIDFYRSELKRIAWRLQYKARVKVRREVPIQNDFLHSFHHTDQLENRLLIKQLIMSLPYETGKKIIYEIYFNDKTEAQIAMEMEISQQAVNKWKKKTLRFLYQKLSS